MSPEVEIAEITIPRRAHMRRSSSADGREGTGYVPDGPPKEVSDREKWHNLCIAIRDAGNLAIEMGSQPFSTNSIVPKCNKKWPRDDLKPCIKSGPLKWDATPISGPDCQLRSPVVWYDGADMVFHYPFDP